MTSIRRQELQKKHLLSLCAALQRYVTHGGDLRVETVHDGDDDDPDSRVVLHVRDWEAFRRALEPNAVLP